MDTILHTTKGAVPMHTAIENDEAKREVDDKFIAWEAIRIVLSTQPTKEP